MADLTGWQLLGIVLLAVVMGGLFALTAAEDGVAWAALLWGGALLLAGVVFVGVSLALGELP